MAPTADLDLPLAARTPHHVRIADYLRSLIHDGQHPPSSRVPSEADLCAHFKVSRTTVRHALGELERDGLIIRQQGRGSFVASPKPGQDLGRLTGLAEAMAAQGREISNQVLGLARVSAPAEVARRLQLDVGETVVALRRVRSIDGVAVSHELSYFPVEFAATLEQADLGRRDVYLVLEADGGLVLGHADWRIDAVGADPELAEALDTPVGEALLRVERLAFSRAGRPIDFEYLHYRGEAFQYLLRTERQPGQSRGMPR